MNILARPLYAILLGVLFAAAAIAGGPASGMETALMEWAAGIRADRPGLARAMAMLTQLGGAPITLTVAGIAALWLLLRRMPGHALLLVVTVVGERLLVDGLKHCIGRPRPPLDALPVSLAFPSGHSANSMTVFLALALIACPPAYRRPAAIVGFCLAVLIGLTRVGLGVHWPSDVVGGWALGLLCVAAALTLVERSAPLRLEAEHDVVGRHRPAIGEDEAA